MAPVLIVTDKMVLALVITDVVLVTLLAVAAGVHVARQVRRARRVREDGDGDAEWWRW